MKTVSTLTKSILSAAACVAVLFAAQPAHAGIGSGVLELSIDNASASNGYSGSTGYPVEHGVMQTGEVSVGGVSGNQGTTYVTCYDNFAGQIFSWSTQVSANASIQWTPEGIGTHYLYCSANYTGYYANGTVSTPNITIQVN